jgi:hypothetical protein
MEPNSMTLKTNRIAHTATLLLALLSAGCHKSEQAVRHEAAVTAAKSGKALYEEKCKTVAGEKIYKTVDNVEGIVLLKVRPEAGDHEWADRMWPGAAFALEARGDEYITTFLGYEHSSSPTGKPITPQYRGYISPNYEPKNPNNNPGYRYVDVIDEKDGKRYRYTGRWEEPWKYDKSYLKGYVKFFLDKTPTTAPEPRYGVTFEDHVIPEERAVGVASSTIKVLDLQTNEELGEMTRYAWSPGGPSSPNPSPWLTAWKCPGQPVGAEAATRKFVDQILIPKKDQ